MLATEYDPNADYTGWWMSQKYDGVRAVCRKGGYFTRSGNRIEVPAWFPQVGDGIVLDGELWTGPGRFGDTLGATSRKVCRPHDWTQVTYQVFDCPSFDGVFEERLIRVIEFVTHETRHWEIARAKEGRVGKDGFPFECPWRVAHQTKARDRDHVADFHMGVIYGGGEGLMLRKPHSRYEPGKRSGSLLKVKAFHDAEAVVLGYTEPDKPERPFRSLLCRLPSGVEFDVGSGLSERDYDDPPRIGSTITFKYQSLNPESGKPRHPVFLRAREEP